MKDKITGEGRSNFEKTLGLCLALLRIGHIFNRKFAVEKKVFISD